MTNDSRSSTDGKFGKSADSLLCAQQKEIPTQPSLGRSDVSNATKQAGFVGSPIRLASTPLNSHSPTSIPTSLRNPRVQALSAMLAHSTSPSAMHSTKSHSPLTSPILPASVRSRSNSGQRTPYSKDEAAIHERIGSPGQKHRLTASASPNKRKRSHTPTTKLSPSTPLITQKINSSNLHKTSSPKTSTGKKDHKPSSHISQDKISPSSKLPLTSPHSRRSHKTRTSVGWNFIRY